MLWALYNTLDRPLNPEVENFFYANDFTPENNVRAVWTGLHAPAGTKDIYEYGLKIYNGEIEHAKHLQFEGEIDYDYLPDNEGKRTIPPANEVNTLYKNNKEFIERYTRFYDYKNYDAPNTISDNLYGQDIITLHRLLPLYWEQMAQNGKGDKAIKWWLKDMTLIQGMMGANTTLVEKAIWMVNYGLTLKALPLILKANPNLIETYQSKITETLDKDFMKDVWDVEETWRGEYNTLRSIQISTLPHNILAFKPNDTRNKFLEIAKDMIDLSKRPAYEIDAYFNPILLKHKRLLYNSYLIFPYNIGGEIILENFLNGKEMYMSGHAITAKHYALILWMQAHDQNIPAEEMEEFLARAPKHLYDPLTGKPFRWDTEKKAIYIERYENDPESRYYIPYE